MFPLKRPLLYLISNRRAFLHSPEITLTGAAQLQIETIREAASAGCRMIQVREKDLSSRQLCEFTRAVIDVARPYGSKVLVNDRLDVAIATGADGVHLRVSSLAASDARKTIGRIGLNGFLIGVSTHTLPEAQAAESGGADFIVCGPVYETQSKGPPLGIDRFAEICRSVKIPTLALGGLNLSNYREPLKCGAAGVAAIGLFTDRETIRRKIEVILSCRISAFNQKDCSQSA